MIYFYLFNSTNSIYLSIVLTFKILYSITNTLPNKLQIIYFSIIDLKTRNSKVLT